MLGRRAREVDLDLVAGDRHPRADLELAFQWLEDVGGLVDAVRQRPQTGPDTPFGVRVQLVHRGLDAIAPVLPAELCDAPLGDALGTELGPEIAEPLVRVAHIRDEQPQHLVVEPDRRDDETLLVDLA